MRFVFLLILLAGLALGIGYPWAVQNVSGYEIGTYRVYDRPGGFRPAEASIAPSEAPVRVLVDMVSQGSYRPIPGRTALTVTVATGGRTVLAETVTFADTQGQQDSPQGQRFVYRDEAGMIREISGDGRYAITVGPGDADDIDLDTVDVILQAGAFDLDPRAVPAGYIMMAVGFIGFVAALRRKRRGKAEASPPPPPKWGR